MKRPHSAYGGRVLSPANLFTNRQDEREIIRTFFNKLADPNLKPEKPIVSLYGVGGVGKTSLLRHVTKDPETIPKGLKVATLDLDQDRWTPGTPIAQFFWELRSALRIPTPLFDLLSQALWSRENPGKEPQLAGGVVSDLASQFGQIGSIANSLNQSLAAAGAIGGAVHFVDKLSRYFRDKQREKKVKARIGVEDITVASVKELEHKLADALYEDLSDWLTTDTARAICICIDGFERIQSKIRAEDVQYFFQIFCGYLTNRDLNFSGRLGFLILGREQLRWQNIYQEDEWRDFVDSHFLEGISEADAHDFFVNAAEQHRTLGDEVVAGMLERHVVSLLSVTREQSDTSPKRRASYHPYYLDLAYKLVCEQRKSFDPESLGRTPNELQIRFLRYVQKGYPANYRALQCLSLAGTFNDDLFRFLANAGHVLFDPPFDFLISSDFSYITETETGGGEFQFHRLMERALIESQSGPGLEAKRTRARVDAILEYFVEQASFGSIAEFGTKQSAAYQQAMFVVFARYQDGFVDFDKLWSVFSQLETRFHHDTSFARERAQWFQHLREVFAAKPLQSENAAHARQTASGLGHLLLSIGRVDEADSILRRVVTDVEADLLPDDPERIAVLNNLGSVCKARGDLDGAESCYTRALEAFGTETVVDGSRADILTIFNNLAGLRADRGELAEAEEIYRYVLWVTEERFTDKHRSTMISQNNLAAVLRRRGNLDEAITLVRHALRSAEAVLGSDHIETIAFADSLGTFLMDSGEAQDESGRLLRRVLDVRVRTLGELQPDTIAALDKVAQILEREGDLERADEFYQQASGSADKVFMPDDRRTLRIKNNWAILLSRMERLAEAGDLGQEVLSRRERLFGERDEDTLMSLYTNGLIHQAKKQYEVAEDYFRRAALGGVEALGLNHTVTLLAISGLEERLTAPAFVAFLNAAKQRAAHLASQAEALAAD